MREIPGREIADRVLQKLRAVPTPKKILAAVLVGDDPASRSFITQKGKTAKTLGVDFRVYEFENGITQDALRKEVARIAGQKSVGGIIVQLPLPVHVNRHYVVNAIPREKDVDVLGERALGAFYTGRNPVMPPVVGVVEETLKETRYALRDAAVALVGLGFLVGRPLTLWLAGKAKEILLLDKNSDLSLLGRADLVISGVGKAGLLTHAMLKKDACVVDFGYSKNGDAPLAGDFDARALAYHEPDDASWYTPTPGGTGPILVAKLFENFYTLTGALGSTRLFGREHIEELE